MGKPLAMFLLLAVLVSQMVAFAPGHSDDEATHCCPVCHAAHAPVLTAVPILHLGLPSVRTYWRVTPDALPSLMEAWCSGACTRGPPSLFLAV
jgi:hypothetical protein